LKHDTLNRRLTQYVGNSSVLEQPISNGYGRARFGDILWRVRGRDCPAGTRVTVTDVDGSDLLVEPDDAGEEKTQGPEPPAPPPGSRRGLF
jgi:membrane protein implicated in regulation of membrane protease activity